MASYDRIDLGDPAEVIGEKDAKWVQRHRGSTSNYLRRHRKWASQLTAKKLDGLREAAPELLSFISDERMLYTALKHMADVGSQAPGPGGLRYEDIAAIGDWQWCRAMRDTIRDGFYTPGYEWPLKIPKGPGRGFRELVVQSIEDRVVGRAVVEVLQPLLDPLFFAHSFGYRPRKGPLRALATAERIYLDRGLDTWVSVDIKNAFPSVPVARLIDVLRKYLPDDDLITFLEAVTRPDKTTGLRQGSPLSPLLLNLYLHHVLDRVWHRLYPDIPLLRFADDILLMCHSPKQACVAYGHLAALLRPAGFMLKETETEAIQPMASGAKVTWMGFDIGTASDGLRFTVNDGGWDSLAETLAAAHGRPNSPLSAIASLAGWIADKGPCYPHTNLERACARIKRIADSVGFDEIPGRDEILGSWQRSFARWGKMQKIVDKS